MDSKQTKSSGSSERLRKRLLLNLDGTGQAQYTSKAAIVNGQQSSVPVSNVARIGRAALIEDEENDFEQVVYYLAGVGADAETAGISESTRGVGVVSKIREAYGFVCNNYDYGDEIYITGFSRGAYIARSVAGLIGKCGILTKTGLEKFYEAFEYYQYSNKYKEKNLPCPVSEAAGTTRVNYPDTNPPRRIKIRAVGVWDTVGGLAQDEYAWHDVSLGNHIEHAYHIISLNERRGYYTPTLWECKDVPRALQNFEQCWLVGDHSNIGGSWDDQQIADIALAWIMSRFDALGVKFDPNYLYGEYLKFQEYVKVKGPSVGYDAKLSPRQWGEGRTQEVYRSPGNVGWGGYEQRTPSEYAGLQHTNETMHPAIRYRHFCKNSGKLGAEDKTGYNPSSLNGWTWPAAQKDGRIGAGSQQSTTGPLTFSKVNAQKKTITMAESILGKYEKQLLALYDQDSALRQRDGSVWTKVLGGTEGPPKDIKDVVSHMVKPGSKPSVPSQQPSKAPSDAPAPQALYAGKRPATEWDTLLMKDYATLGNSYRVGSWNGSDTCSGDGEAPFSCLGTTQTNSKIKTLEFLYDDKAKALAGFYSYYNDNINEWYNWAEEAYTKTTLTLANDEAVVGIETKAGKSAVGQEIVVQGLKLTTDKGQVWTSSQYDQLGGDSAVTENAPGSGWALKGFYGAIGTNINRLGPVWGK